MADYEFTVILPEGVAQRALEAGLLVPERLAALIEEALAKRDQRAAFKESLDKLSALPPMSREEIAAEIQAARREKKR